MGSLSEIEVSTKYSISTMKQYISSLPCHYRSLIFWFDANFQDLHRRQWTAEIHSQKEFTIYPPPSAPVKPFFFFFFFGFVCHDIAVSASFLWWTRIPSSCDFSLKTNTPDVSCNIKLSEWFCNLHNSVNVRLGKAEFDCSKVRFYLASLIYVLCIWQRGPWQTDISATVLLQSLLMSSVWKKSNSIKIMHEIVH